MSACSVSATFTYLKKRHRYVPSSIRHLHVECVICFTSPCQNVSTLPSTATVRWASQFATSLWSGSNLCVGLQLTFSKPMNQERSIKVSVLVGSRNDSSALLQLHWQRTSWWAVSASFDPLSSTKLCVCVGLLGSPFPLHPRVSWGMSVFRQLTRANITLMKRNKRILLFGTLQLMYFRCVICFTSSAEDPKIAAHYFPNPVMHIVKQLLSRTATR